MSGQSLRVPIYCEPTADAYVVAREAIALSKRLGVVVLLQITPSASVDVDGEYPPAESILATSILRARSVPQPV